MLTDSTWMTGWDGARLDQQIPSLWRGVLAEAAGWQTPELAVSSSAMREAGLIWFSYELAPSGGAMIALGMHKARAVELGKAVLSHKGRPSEHEHHALHGAGYVFQQLATALAKGAAGPDAWAEPLPEPAAPIETPAAAFSVTIRSEHNEVFEIAIACSNHNRESAEPVRSRDLAPVSAPPAPKNLDVLLGLEMPVSVVFGATRMPLKDIVKLKSGSVVEFERALSEPVEVLVNDAPVARGEVVVIDGNFGVRITEIMSKQERLRSFA